VAFTNAFELERLLPGRTGILDGVSGQVEQDLTWEGAVLRVPPTAQPLAVTLPSPPRSVRTSACEVDAGRLCELAEIVDDRVDEVPEVGHELAAGDQTEVERV
jgi:hypothetical protein